MYARKLLAATVTAAVTASALALTAGSASAAVDPDDTTFTPSASDLITVGSDTSQNTLKRLAEGWTYEPPTFHERNEHCTDRPELPECRSCEPTSARATIRNNASAASTSSGWMTSAMPVVGVPAPIPRMSSAWGDA